MFGLQEIIRVNQLAVERPKENTGDHTGLINCQKQPGLIPQCSRCSNYTVYTVCLEISQALNN